MITQEYSRSSNKYCSQPQVIGKYLTSITLLTFYHSFILPYVFMYIAFVILLHNPSNKWSSLIQVRNLWRWQERNWHQVKLRNMRTWNFLSRSIFEVPPINFVSTLYLSLLLFTLFVFCVSNLMNFPDTLEVDFGGLNSEYPKLILWCILCIFF